MHTTELAVSSGCVIHVPCSSTNFGLGTVLGEMSGLVAVSTQHGLAGVVPAWHTRY